MSKPVRFLTKEEAAEFLGISVRAVERLITNREVAFYKFGESKSSSIRLSESDLLKWVAKYRNEAQTA